MDNIINMEWLNTDNDMFSTLLGINQPECQSEIDSPTPQSQKTILEPTLSVVRSEDNFVNMLPGSTSKTPKTSSNRKRFMQPVFVTESPEKAYVDASSNSKKNFSGSDSEEDLSRTSQPQKLMTSKERRQMRNKISARNFRVRRKEYISQLEQKLDEHEKTIHSLKEENTKLRKANEELMQQLLQQPPLAPSTSTTSDELVSSSSEGQSSPEQLTNLPFQFTLDDMYDFSLFDRPEQQPEQPVFNLNTFNSFYLNHTVTPSWNIHHLLTDKIKSSTDQEERLDVARKLLLEYPLMGAALMSIVLRHTMTLEYVTQLANEFSDLTINNSKIVTEEKQPKARALIENKPEQEQEEKFDTDKISDEELMNYIFTYNFSHYAFSRARGLKHNAILLEWRDCLKTHKHCQEDFIKKMRINEDAKPSKSKGSKSNNKLQTLQTYCKVAGTLLRHPQRMSNVNKVLREKMNLPRNEHTQRVEQKYISMMNPQLRISSS
ncbi:hypothetical protein G6F37_000242 [Rhizopus arrhizus]|nr:hypothetical protein G6F38_000122 [Rhizopus arrhizus]KAG1164489.1 hypothetical protein G6F37_000242 [Rhizopus arrhizus]